MKAKDLLFKLIPDLAQKFHCNFFKNGSAVVFKFMYKGHLLMQKCTFFKFFIQKSIHIAILHTAQHIIF